MLCFLLYYSLFFSRRTIWWWFSSTFKIIYHLVHKRTYVTYIINNMQGNSTFPRLLKFPVNPLPLPVFVPSPFVNTSQTLLLASFSFLWKHILQIFLQEESVVVDHFLLKTFLIWLSLKDTLLGMILGLNKLSACWGCCSSAFWLLWRGCWEVKY